MEIKRNGKPLDFKKLLQYFVQGLAVIAPVGITLYAVVWLFLTIDNLLPNIIEALFPEWVSNYIDDIITAIPGLGFILVVLIVFLVGRFSSTYVLSWMVELLDNVLERAPGIKFIYKSLKDFFEAFTGNKRKFDVPALVNVDGADVWRIGFVTHESAAEFDLIDHAVVYVPLSYAITGITYFVPRDKIRLLPEVGSADAMKFAVSGGVSDVE